MSRAHDPDETIAPEVSVELLQTLHDRLDAFRSSWGQPTRPKITDYLHGFAGSARSKLLAELLRAELTCRVAAQEQPHLSEYLAAYPEDEVIVRDAFATQTLAESPPERIARYAVRNKLGEGSYGTVYLAQDTQLDRLVALKVAHPQTRQQPRPDDLAGSLYEAKQAVAVESPGIVRVLDIDLQHDPPYIVMEYVPGGSLREALARGVDLETAVSLTLALADALGHAHQNKIFHLDLKPANVLLDAEGHPRITDFGFAIHRAHRNRYVGTPTGSPAYMAPEQVRCEANRYDGRTDLWSLGVMFYEMLTGTRPFDALTRSELLASIVDANPQPPRQLNPSIPPAIQRICLKCLAPEQGDRYSTAADLAADLQWWTDTQHHESAQVSGKSPAPLAAANEPPATPPVRPQGLRSFDREHADFYLSLLPGRLNRDGIPESIAFWKRRIESRNHDAFPVGVLFGPSGCGKSSLVAAGIIPQLGPDIVPLEVDCTAEGSAVTVRSALEAAFPKVRSEPTLAAAVARLREEPSLRDARKILLVLNQFEQYLHKWDAEQPSDLLDALRHLDGHQVQALVTVRSDFFHSLSQCLRRVGVPLREGTNLAGVDLFDKQHAQRVLGLFGQAWGRLSDPVTEAEAAFLEQVVGEVARDGKVVCVRLAVIAEMMKHRDWTAAEWAQVGRSAGVGEAFLEETFSTETAPPTHRTHQEAARRVLRALLPDATTNIKAGGRSRAELREASQYKDPTDFEELLDILDNQVRLITPVENHQRTADPEERVERHYQLSHDYLVPSLRSWLTRKQRESHRGRAELLLSQHTAWWNAHQLPRFLPSFTGWARIRLWTQPHLWTTAQRNMMRRADRRALRYAVLMLVALLASRWAYSSWSRHEASRQVSVQGQGKSEVRRLLSAERAAVPQVITDMRSARHLRAVMLEALTLQEGWRSCFAQLALSEDDALRADSVAAILRVVTQEPIADDDLLAIHQCLAETTAKQTFEAELWRAWEAGAAGDARPTSIAVALAAVLPENDPRWNQIAIPVADWLVNRPPGRVTDFLQVLHPAGPHLIRPLAQIAYRHSDSATDASVNAAAALATYATERDLRDVMTVALKASKGQLAALLPWLAEHPHPVSQHCNIVLGREEPDDTLELAVFRERSLRTLSQEFANFYGLLDVDQAWCPPLPRSQFLGLNERLKEHGYRPARIRPLEREGTTYIAASWQRDGADYALELDLSATELSARNQALRARGLYATDLSYRRIGDDGAFACLWTTYVNPPLEARIELDLSAHEARALTANGHQDQWSIIAITATKQSATQERFAAICHQLKRDATVSHATQVIDTGIAEGGPWVIDDFSFRRPSDAANVTTERYYRGQTTAAAEPYWKLSTWWGGAREQHPAEYVRTQGNPSGAYSLRLSAADPADVFLEQTVTVAPHKPHLLSGWIKTEDVSIHEGGSHAAHLSIFNPGDFKPRSASVARSQDWSYITLEFDSGEFDYVHAGPRLGNTSSSASGVAWFDDLCLIELTEAEARSPDRLTPAFLTAARRDRNLLRNGNFDFPPAALVRSAQPDRESSVIELTDLATHRQQATKHMLRGFRIASLNAQSIDGEMRLASVWQRETTLELANAAVIHSKCQSLADTLATLQEDADPTARAQFISRLSIARHGQEEIVTLIRAQTSPAVRQGLLLSLVDTTRSDETASAALEELLDELAFAADPGVRAASAWVAHQLGYRAPTAAQRGRDRSGTRWLLTPSGHRLVVLQDGSQRFAIAEAEVTVEQYERFATELKQEGITATIDRGSPSLRNHPQTNVGFYQAAMYCRWLGEQEHLPEALQFYPPLPTLARFARDEIPHAEFAGRLGDLQRSTGYRLPTEGEFVLAAGPTMDAARFPELMLEYGKFSSIAANATAGLIRQRKPNLYGLFDMWGNAMEWGGHYAGEQPNTATTWYVLSGGSFGDPPARMTSRIKDHPLNNFYRYGFRIARTWTDE